MADARIVVALLLVAACATVAALVRAPVRQALVPAVLGVVLAGSLAVGWPPASARWWRAPATRPGPAVPWSPHRTGARPVCCWASPGPRRPWPSPGRGRSPPGVGLPLRRLQSGHVGDYVASVPVGATVLGALALPGLLA